MAISVGKPCVSYISGSGLGCLYMMHLVSANPNAGPYHAFKGFNTEIPFECKMSSLESEDGVVTLSTGHGIGYRSQLSGKAYLGESVMLF